MNILLVAVFILPLAALSDNVKPPVVKKRLEPEPHNPQRTVRLGLRFVKDLVTLSLDPTLDNMAKVTPQLGVIGVLGGLANIAEIVGGIADLIFPDNTMEEVKRMFNMLLHEIANVREDIRRLERLIEWGNTQLTYSHVVNVITTATDLAQKISTSESEAERQRRQDRFAEHCQNQGLQMSLNVLFNGLTGKGFFQSNILASFYRLSRGHAPNMVKLGGRLLNLASGGLISLMTYESIVRGRGGAEDIARDYQPRMLETRISTEDNLNRCIEEYKENMAADLTHFMSFSAGGPNSRVAEKLNSQMQEKYPWLAIATVLYNRRYRRWRHRVRTNRNHVMSRINFGPTRKNAHLCFVNKGAPFVNRHKRQQAYNAIRFNHRDIRKSFRRNLRSLRSAGITFWALITAQSARSRFTVAGDADGRVLYRIMGRQSSAIFLQ